MHHFLFPYILVNLTSTFNFILVNCFYSPNSSLVPQRLAFVYIKNDENILNTFPNLNLINFGFVLNIRTTSFNAVFEQYK